MVENLCDSCRSDEFLFEVDTSHTAHLQLTTIVASCVANASSIIIKCS